MESNEPVFLTKNGYGTMVLLSIEQYSALTDDTERKLDEADAAAVKSDKRYSADAHRDAALLCHDETASGTVSCSDIRLQQC